MIDMVDVFGFKECVNPKTIRIMVESCEELFENPERLIN